MLENKKKKQKNKKQFNSRQVLNHGIAALTFSLLLRSASQAASSFILLLESYQNHTIKYITQLSQKYQRTEKNSKRNSNFITFIVSNGISTVASCFCPKPRVSDPKGGMRGFDPGPAVPFFKGSQSIINNIMNK